MKAVNTQLFTGIDRHTFAPCGKMTCAVFVTALARLKKAALDNYHSSPFHDVSPDAWYGRAVAWAYENGIIAGVISENFVPD